MNKTTVKIIITSLIVAIVALAVLIAASLGLGALGLPFWPFAMFLFYYTTIIKMDKTKLMKETISGLAGIFVGLSAPFFTDLGMPVVGIIVFLVGMVALIAMSVMYLAPPMATLMLTVTTTISNMTAGDWSGLAPTHPAYATLGMPMAFLRIAASFLICAAIFALLAALDGKNKKEA